MITTRDWHRALDALRAGHRAVLEVPPASVESITGLLDRHVPQALRQRIRVRGTDAVLRSGCITLRTTRTGVQVGLYHSAESDLESDESLPYTTVCETHGTLVSHETRRAAVESLPHPEWWCDDCRGNGEGT